LYMAQLAIFAIVEKNHVLMKRIRPGRMTIAKQQGMEVLGMNLSLFVLVKDRDLEPSMSF
jgi:hypothetical protein